MPVATVFTGPGIGAILAVAVAAFFLARRSWRSAVVLVVVADALTWSWLGWLKTVGNVVYWGAAAGVAASLLLLARSSRPARLLLAVVVVATAALAATAAWSFEPHATARASATLGSALAVAAFAAVRALGEVGGCGQLARALGAVAPFLLAVTFLIIVFDHSRAVAEGGGISGVLNGPNSLGILLALALGFLLATQGVEHRLVVLVAWVAVLGFVVTLSASRTGMLAGLAALVAYELGMRRWRRLAAAVAAAVAAGALAAAWVPDVPTLGRPIVLPTHVEHGSVQPAPVQHGPPQATQIFGGRVHGQSVFSSLVGARDEAWIQAADLLDRRPLSGSGFGTGGEIFAHDAVRHEFRNFIGAFDPHANVHDSYLQALLELGIPGGLIFLAPLLGALALVVRGLVRGWRSAGEAAFGAAAAAAVVAAVFESILSGFGAMTLIAWLSFAMLICPTFLHSLGAEHAGYGRRRGRTRLLASHASAQRS